MKIFKEPLLHFLIIGAFLFLVYSWRNPVTENPLQTNKIKVTSADIERIQSLWKKQRGRFPTEVELKGLINNHVRQQILYREAVKLGLEQNDVIIERRLVQKMEFLSEDLATLQEPTEDILKKYYDENQDTYLIPAQFSFEHIYFNEEHHTNNKQAALKTLDKIVNDQGSKTSHSNLGDPFMLSFNFIRKSQEDIRYDFGDLFAKSLVELSSDQWQGPIESSYGFHLVRIYEFIEPYQQEFSDVKETVTRDYLFQLRQDAKKKFYAQLMKNYEIEIDSSKIRQPVRADQLVKENE